MPVPTATTNIYTSMSIAPGDFVLLANPLCLTRARIVYTQDQFVLQAFRSAIVESVAACRWADVATITATNQQALSDYRVILMPSAASVSAFLNFFRFPTD